MQALSPLDDRYAQSVEELLPVFSEMGLAKRRLKVEVDYLIWLVPLVTGKTIEKKAIESLSQMVYDFEKSDFKAIKEHEKKCRHDVKAVEYFLDDRLDEYDLSHLKQWVHFGLMSEDTNNIAQTVQLRDGSLVLLTGLSDVLRELGVLVEAGSEAVMLGRTHGQPAVPTTLGKEILVHALGLLELGEELAAFQYRGKIGGAVGTKAAHYQVFPEIDWDTVLVDFLARFSLKNEPVNTQVLAPVSWIGLFSIWARIALLLEGLAKDLWWYVALDYFDQAVAKGQVGSSTMPQKVNPILLENSEGNAKLAYTLLEHFGQVFSYSRLQRDLSDSTVRRNFGVAFGHLLLALRSMEAGLKSLSLNQSVMANELEGHYEVLAEAVQSKLRKLGETEAYEQAKQTTQGKTLTRTTYRQWISALKLSQTDEKQLLSLKPQDYIGNAKIQVQTMLPGLKKRIIKLAKGVS